MSKIGKKPAKPKVDAVAMRLRGNEMLLQGSQRWHTCWQSPHALDQLADFCCGRQAMAAASRRSRLLQHRVGHSDGLAMLPAENPCSCSGLLICLQVTSHQLQKSREADAKTRAAAAEEDAAAKKRLVSEDAYAALVDVSLAPARWQCLWHCV